MKRLHVFFVPCLLLVFAGLSQAQSNVPTLISYQAHVTDDSNAPIGAANPVNRTVKFTFWNHASNATDPNRLYAENQVVTISDGDLSVLIGQGTPTGENRSFTTLDGVFGTAEVFLGITVDDGNPATTDAEISPRQRIVTTAFAFRSKVAEAVDEGAITSAMLANNAVESGDINDLAVTTAKIGNDAVTGIQIAPATIETSDLKDNSVTTEKINADAVTTDKILNGTIATLDLADLAVTNAKLALNSVGSDRIIDGSVTTSDLDLGIGVFSRSGSNLTHGSVNSGRVGIGTSNPNSRLHIDGDGTSHLLRAELSGNPKFVVGMNGGTSIGTDTSAPANGLRVKGGVKLGTDAEELDATGGEESLRILRGTVRLDLTTGLSFEVAAGSGWNFHRNSAGDYTINFVRPFSSPPSVTVTPLQQVLTFGGVTYLPENTFANIHSINPQNVSIHIREDTGNGSANKKESGFSFIVVGPR